MTKNKRILKIILILAILVLSVLMIRFAWAKYRTILFGKTSAEIANWHFELKNVNGETMSENEINFPITRIDSNTSVDSETIAPGTYGMFHVIVDTTGTEVSLYYDLDINIDQCPENLKFYQSRSELEDPKTFDDMDKLNEFLAKEAQEIQEKQTNNEEDPEHKAEVYKKDSTKKAMSKEENKLSIKRFMAINDDGTKNEDGTAKSLAGKVYLETIYWEWPFQTGKVDKTTGIAEGDLEDSESMGKVVTMSIALTGIQMDKEIDTYRSTVLLAGPNFNSKLSELAGEKANITAFKKSETEPNEEQKNAENIISISGSKYPVYAWYDNGNIYYWSEAENIYMNSNASTMFQNMSSIKQIDLHDFDTIKVTHMTSMFQGCGNLTSLDLSNFDTSNVKDMSDMFNGCRKVSELDISKFNTSKVTSMAYMFYDCKNVHELDVSKFDTSKVTNMAGMFFYCTNVSELDISKFNTSKVTSMAYMFYDCKNVHELDVSKFDTSKVTNMASLFCGCSNVNNLDVGKFDTSNVTGMTYMFSGCSNVNELDVSGFNTSNVSNMQNMFSGCSKVSKLDVSKFDTSNVTSMTYMFFNCNELKTIYVGEKWTMKNVTEHTAMFFSAVKLLGGAGTTYNSEHEDGSYAHVDGGEKNPGYFTLKTN